MAGYESHQWFEFGVAIVGAAAVLSGLLFVAMSINIERIMAIVTLPARAAGTLVLFVIPLMVAADQRRQLVGELWGVAKTKRLRRDTQAGGVGEVLDEDGERRLVRRWHFVRLATSRCKTVEPAEPAMATAAGTAPQRVDYGYCQASSTGR